LLFADDTSIFLSHTDQEYLTTSLNEELKKLNIWMKTNKFSVNINKTNYVIFSSKQKTTKINLPVLFDDKPLKRVNVVKFLGIYIDENLTWKYHIDHVIKFLNRLE
jgi:hypothetical protein